MLSPSQNEPGSRFSLGPERIPSARIHHHILKQHGGLGCSRNTQFKQILLIFHLVDCVELLQLEKLNPRYAVTESDSEQFCGF